MRFLARTHALMVALLVMLGLTAVSLPWAVMSMRKAVERTRRHDIAWTGANGRNDFNDLRIQVLAFATSQDSARREAAEVAFQVFQSRIMTWRSGDFGAFVKASSRLDATTGALVAIVDSLEPLMGRLDSRQALSLIVAGLESLDPLVEEISRQAYIENNNQVLGTHRELDRFQFVQQLLIVALVLIALLLAASLLFQKWLLSKSLRAEMAAAERNAFLAAHDLLTGLPNRATMLTALERTDGMADDGSWLAVLMVDLDGFKPINDVLGHATGDALLRSVADRLSAIAARNPGALAARFGGDEFVVVAPNLSSQDACKEIAAAILSALSQPHAVGTHTVSVDATVGVALSGPDLQADDLIHRADMALHRAKANAKGTYVVFEPSMIAEVAARQTLETDLAAADVEAEIVPYYQVQVDLRTGEVLGVEALARWCHPARGFVSPGEFIPVAESSGRIVEIGRVMLEKACRDAMLFPSEITIAVNLSAVQLLRTDVPALVSDVLASTGLDPGRLKLEITESVIANDFKRTRALIQTLQGMGVSVSLDDFGTGYSSLSYLSQYGFNELKIDRSFVIDVCQRREALAIVQTIISLARNLDMKVTAEGIEDDDQATLLKAAGCLQGQGYLFGRAEPIDVLLNRLNSETPGWIGHLAA